VREDFQKKVFFKVLKYHNIGMIFYLLYHNCFAAVIPGNRFYITFG
jgi:hypothetical protein